MRDAEELLLAIVVLLNFVMLGVGRMRAMILVVATQGCLLGMAFLILHGGAGVLYIVIGALAIALKTVLIPLMLLRAMRDVAIRREVEPYIGAIPSLMLAAAATAASIIFAAQLPLLDQHRGSLLIPAAFATVLSGFIVLTTRRKAITQVIGYLMIDNGIFLFGLTLAEAIPYIVETGVLLDLFVGIFVMGIALGHINREFSSGDDDDLTALKE